MLNIDINKKLIYPKIDTLFQRNPNTYKINTDQVRDPIFNLISKWEVTEKIDGTNIRIVLNDGNLYFLGRTEKAEIPKPLENWLFENVSKEKLLEVFEGKDVVLYGEGYGSKIQQGEGYSPIQKFILFDIKIGQFWLKRNSIEEIATNMDLDVVPLIGEMTTDEIIELVKTGFPSKIGNYPISEGIIARTSTPLQDMKNNRLIFKLKYSDFERQKY